MKTKKNSFKGKSLYRPTGKAGEYSAWACNFYTGCSNNCSYCYCKRGVMSHVWSDEPMLKKCFKDKDHAVAVFEKEMLANIDELRKTGIFFSFTTDPMIPGKTLELTMEAVGLALRNDVPVQILAKRADWLDAEAWKVMCATINPDYKKIAVGFTLTRRDDLEPGASPHTERIVAMKRCHELGCHTFASVEPILEPIEVPRCKWLIVGAETGRQKDKVIPQREWIEHLVYYCGKWNIPLFMKSSLADIWGEPLIQEFPKELMH